MNLHQCHTGPRATRGFTIIELLIVIVIVSILAALAIPSYREYVMRSHRTVAKVALQDLLTRQESYAVDHKSYAADFERLGVAGSGAAGVAYVTTDGVISRNVSNALYSFALKKNTGSSVSTCVFDASPTALGFSLIATPVGSNTDTKCGTLCITSGGDRGANPGVVADCWRR